MPDYDDDETKSIDVKSNLDANDEWTAPADGYVNPKVLSGYDAYVITYVNGIRVAQAHYSSNWTSDPGPIPVAKGDVIKFSAPSNLSSAKFYPCK